jgi:uncharacterized protein involved in response to NO
VCKGQAPHISVGGLLDFRNNWTGFRNNATLHTSTLTQLWGAGEALYNTKSLPSMKTKGWEYFIFGFGNLFEIGFPKKKYFAETN